MNLEYINEIKQKALDWAGGKKETINWIDTDVPAKEQEYLDFGEEAHEREE
ncbi:MAG: hypothetical protein LBK73_07535 [Treponema sp.]|jgi:hypothetical protein|nr:hypothetical protein [Treponema sp.]